MTPKFLSTCLLILFLQSAFAGEFPRLEVEASIRSFDEHWIVAELKDKSRIKIPRNAIENPRVDKDFRQFPIKIEYWKQIHPFGTQKREDW